MPLIDKKLDFEPSFESMMQFISKNTTLRKAIAAIEIDDPRLTRLSQAIENADLGSDIYHDKDCDLLLLKLIKDKRINFWVGITSYHYLICLMQYTGKQSLKTGDEERKLTDSETGEAFTHIPYFMLVEENKLTEAGNQYVDQVINRYLFIGKEVLKKALVDIILKLPKSEQVVLLPPHHTKCILGAGLRMYQEAYEKLENPIIRTVPFFAFTPSAFEQDTLAIPSMTFIRKIQTLVLPNQGLMEPLPIFGSVGTEKLEALHRKDLHPLPLYSKRVKSNMPHAHDCIVSSTILHHDVYHPFSANIFGYNNRRKVETHVIPAIERLLEKECSHEIIKLLQKVKDKLFDYDLGLLLRLDNELLFIRYLAQAFQVGYPQPLEEYSIFNIHPQKLAGMDNPTLLIPACFSFDFTLYQMVCRIVYTPETPEITRQLFLKLLNEVKSALKFRFQRQQHLALSLLDSTKKIIASDPTFATYISPKQMETYFEAADKTMTGLLESINITLSKQKNLIETHVFSSQTTKKIEKFGIFPNIKISKNKDLLFKLLIQTRYSP